MIAARGVAFGDWDNDGRVDMFHAEGSFQIGPTGHRIAVLHNEDGAFAAQNALIEADLPGTLKGAGPVFGDYDNDGDLDLFVPIGSFNYNARNLLLRNDRGQFTDVTVEAGLADEIWPTNSAVWLDYDRDGLLDLYVGNFGNPFLNGPFFTNTLFRNRGDGSFEDVTRQAGLYVQMSNGGNDGGTVAADLDGDGWTDLYLGCYGYPNRLFLNDGQGAFRDASGAEIGDAGQANGVAAGDIDNDGDLDIFQTAGGNTDQLLFTPQLLLNLGAGQFLDVLDGAGLQGLSAVQSLGAAFGDLDDDGDLDLLVGYLGGTPLRKHVGLFLNRGDGTFDDASAGAGIAMPTEAADPVQDRIWGIGLGDTDGDGFLDALIGHSGGLPSLPWGRGLFHNEGNANHYLRVALVGTRSNRDGIGAQVTAEAGGLRQTRQILGRLGRCQNERVAHFGLGARERVDRLEVRWPSGQVDEFLDVTADQRIRVVEGRGQYRTVGAAVWDRGAPPEAVVAGTRLDLAAAVRPALFEVGARISRVTADLSAFGGPAAVDLPPAGDGVYELRAGLDVMGASGPRILSVLIEQATSLGPGWSRLSRTLSVWPAADVDVFTDAAGREWAVHGSQPATRLSRDSHNIYTRPAWSPDGTRIAFQSFRDGTWNVFVMNADGSGVVQLTHDAVAAVNPSWSPDGNQIAFISYRNGNGDLYVTRVDGTELRRLTDAAAQDDEPVWSPDGSRIAFSSDRSGDWEVYVMDADGGEPVNVSRNPAQDNPQSWSPDGERLSFYTNRDGNFEVYVMDADGNNPVNVSQHPADDYGSDWSPDGTRIAFQSWRADGTGDIYLVDPDGSNPVRFTDNPAKDDWPDWSPDGTQIAFVSSRDGRPQIYVKEATGVVSLDAEERGVVFEGETSLAVHARGSWSLGQVAAAPGPGFGYDRLQFAFHPGEVAADGQSRFGVAVDQLVEVKGGEGAVASTRVAPGQTIELLGASAAGSGIDLARREWQVVQVPLAALGVQGPIQRIVFAGSLQGTFYLDDVRLLPGEPAVPTAVTEPAGPVTPMSFSLEPSYPNPFNSGTTIRFVLPRPGLVDLALYNLLGQRLARLVADVQPAGTHAVRWDGRDEAGRPLASGVYFCQLRYADQILTRKLMLLR